MVPPCPPRIPRERHPVKNNVGLDRRAGLWHTTLTLETAMEARMAKYRVDYYATIHMSGKFNIVIDAPDEDAAVEIVEKMYRDSTLPAPLNQMSIDDDDLDIDDVEELDSDE
jgi:hypothetical protein